MKYFYDARIIEDVIKKPYSTEEKDLIMLVQGNRYRKWDIIDSARLSKNARIDDNFFGVRGTILNKKSLPTANVIVTLFSTSKGIFKPDTTDQRGRFNFNLPGVIDTTQFMLQATDYKGTLVDVTISLDSTLLPKFSTPKYLRNTLPAPATKEIVEKRGEPQDFLLPGQGKELKEVIVKTRIKKPLSYDDQKRVSQFSRIITPEMLERASFGTLSNVLFMIPGAHMLNGKLIIDPGGDAEPLLIMDDVEVTLGNSMIHTTTSAGADTQIAAGSIEGPSALINFINGLSPAYIDFVEVLNGPKRQRSTV